MGILQSAVDPGYALAGQFARQLAGREQHLPLAIAQPIPVDVDVLERIVAADLLQLPEGLLERLPIPEPDVVDSVPVRLDRSHVEGGAGLVSAHLDRGQTEGFPRGRDVAPEIGLLERQLVRHHGVALHRNRQQDQDQEHGGHKDAGQHGQPPHLAGSDHGIDEDHEAEGQQSGSQQRPPRDVNGGVTSPKHRACGLGQQLVAIEDVSRRPGEQEQRGVGEKMVEHRSRSDDSDTRHDRRRARPGRRQ